MKILITLIVLIIIAVGAYYIWGTPVEPITSNQPITTNPLATSSPATTTPSNVALATSTIGTPSTTPSDGAASAPTVTYSDTGFSPKSITIKVGETVTFVNAATRTMWPASDDHPTHLLYSEFDSKKGIPVGSVYTFTFTKVGSWAYHDHLKASMRGTVIVQ